MGLKVSIAKVLDLSNSLGDLSFSKYEDISCFKMIENVLEEDFYCSKWEKAEQANGGCWLRYYKFIRL